MTNTLSLTPCTTAELRAQRDKVEQEMRPHTVDILRRLREACATNFKEEELLDRYETLTWLIDE